MVIKIIKNLLLSYLSKQILSQIYLAVELKILNVSNKSIAFIFISFEISIFSFPSHKYQKNISRKLGK